jgi:parvulin-like peptidyl-prolyl isomerase
MTRLVVTLVIGFGIGAAVTAAWLWPDGAERDTSGPWVAKVGDRIIRPADFIEEMERRGGRRPGMYQSFDQKRLLLNEMIIRAALVDAAKSEAFDEDPEVKRAMESILINRYRQERLQPLRDSIRVEDEAVEAFYAENAGDYVVPARKRIAIIQFDVPERADEARWEDAMAEAETVLAQVPDQDLGVPHFGDLARQHSDHRGSRYRGGVIGWVSEGGDRPRFNPTVSMAAESLNSVGAIVGPVRGDDGVYLVRLVDFEPQRERSLENLSAGIRQRLLSEALKQVEDDFIDARLAEVQTQIDEDALAQIEPLAPPGSERRGPPTGPTSAEDEES